MHMYSIASFTLFLITSPTAVPTYLPLVMRVQLREEVSAQLSLQCSDGVPHGLQFFLLAGQQPLLQDTRYIIIATFVYTCTIPWAPVAAGSLGAHWSSS